MDEATISGSAFPSRSSKGTDEVRRQGYFEHAFGKEVGSSLNRGHHFSESRANVRSSAAAEKGGDRYCPAIQNFIFLEKNLFLY